MSSIFLFIIDFYQIYSFLLIYMYYTYSIINSILLTFFIIFFIFYKKYSNTLVSPLICLNEIDGNIINLYNTYQKKIKISLIIHFTNLILFFISLLIEIFITFMIKKEEKKSEKEAEIEREKGIKTLLIEDTNTEMKINFED